MDEIFGLAMIKLLHLKTVFSNTMKVKLIRNVEFFDITNNLSEMCILNKD